MATALKTEALPMLDPLSQALGRNVGLICLEDDTQCLAVVQKGYSAGLRHLERTERIALSVEYEQFFGDKKD
eukprot:10526320-Heterocapsa_arctica.AAC.1